jgi:hypothetical protein
MKSTNKMPALFSCLVLLASAGLSTPARADQWDKKTIMTISEPVQVPNRVLDPGTYVFKLLDSPADRHVVQIFDKDGLHLVTTILAIPNYRLQPTGKTEFAFWETPAGQPRAMRAWFYPGDNFGQEFAYPKAMSSQIAESNGNVSVPVEAAPVASTTTPEPQPAVQPAPEPAPEPQTTAAVTPEPKPEPEPAVAQSRPVEPSTTTSPELPHTASYYPAILLAGLLSLVAFAIMTVRTKRTS